MSNTPPRILPHGPPEQLAPRLWQVSGPLRGMALTRTMVVHRLASGGLLLHSAMALNDAGMAALEALGRPRFVIVPSHIHRGDAVFYKARYPELRVLCPQAVLPKVRKHLAVDATAEEVLPAEGVQCLQAAGVRPGELTYAVPTGDGVGLVFTDLLFNMPRGRGFAGWLMHMLGSSGAFGITSIGRLFSLRDARAFREWLNQLADTPDLNLICVAHGLPIREKAAGRLREAADRLR